MGSKCLTCSDRHKTDKEEPCSTCSHNYFDKHTAPTAIEKRLAILEAIYNKIDCVPADRLLFPASNIGKDSTEERLDVLEKTVYKFIRPVTNT